MFVAVSLALAVMFSLVGRTFPGGGPGPGFPPISPMRRDPAGRLPRSRGAPAIETGGGASPRGIPAPGSRAHCQDAPGKSLDVV